MVTVVVCVHNNNYVLKLCFILIRLDILDFKKKKIVTLTKINNSFTTVTCRHHVFLWD